MLVDDRADPFDGYWRVVKREVYQRFTLINAWKYGAVRPGQPRSYAHRVDERLPPFSDWSIDANVDTAVPRIREVDAYRPRAGGIGSDGILGGNGCHPAT